MYMTPDLHSIPIWEGDDLLASNMKRLVITCVVEPFNLTWWMNGVGSTIICIFMQNHVDLTMMRATQVTISRPGNSWSSIPVTGTFLPVLSRMQTAAPAKPSLATLSTRDPYEEAECLEIW